MAPLMKKRDQQGQGGVDRGILDRFALGTRVRLDLPGLHDRGVQIKVVRHHRRAQDRDRDIEHGGIGHDL
jgi:hypothetical protein